MAKTGRPRIPTALKVLRGNPGRRPLNGQEPKPPAGIPDAPATLDVEARREWDRITGELAAVGLLTRVDRATLTGYCLAWSTVLDATARLKGAPTTLVTETGVPHLNPEIARLNTALRQLKDFAIEFGMSPASRSRIRVDEPPKEGELQQFRRRHPR